MRTGQCACVAQAELTEPSKRPVSPPCPRVPTTSIAASFDAATRSLAALPFHALLVNQLGVPSGKTQAAASAPRSSALRCKSS